MARVHPKPSALPVEVLPGIRRHPLHKEKLVEIPFDSEPGCNTAWKCFRRSVDRFGSRYFLGSRSYLSGGRRGRYHWETYKDCYDQITNYSYGLKALCGLESGPQGAEQARVAIHSISRAEFTKAIFACHASRAVCCPIFDTHGKTEIAHILTQSEVTVVFCELRLLLKLLESKAGSKLEHVIVFEEFGTKELKLAKAANVELYSLKSLEKAGQALREEKKFAEQELEGPEVDDWAFIIYTSGTSGRQKGCILSHRNCLAAAAGMYRIHEHLKEEAVKDTDIYLSYLPLAHCMEACVQIVVCIAGAAIAYYQGDMAKLLTHDVLEVRPTLFASVPRILERIQEKALEKIAEKSFISRKLFDVSFNIQKKLLSKGRRSKVLDFMVFRKISMALGGRLRIMLTGAAPISHGLHEFLKASLGGCKVLQGYGLTENFGGALGMTGDLDSYSNVGGPLGCTEVKLEDVEHYTAMDMYPTSSEEFGQDATWGGGDYNPNMAGWRVKRGEICIRGPHLFLGYLNERNLHEIVDAEGWLHTGDIGMINLDGTISVMERRTNLITLNQGSTLSPAAVEASICGSPLITQAFVYGGEMHAGVVAILVPAKDHVIEWAKYKNLGLSDLKEICSLPDFRQCIFDEIHDCCQMHGLRSYEVPVDFELECEVNELGMGFHIQNQCLTPTLKLCRPKLREKYQRILADMYRRSGMA